jgi:ribosomal protein S19
LSRNSDRLGAQSVQSGAPPPQITQNNDANPFSFVVPTEFVELPSKGKYYPEHHPLHNQETIEIKHMTAKEEDILTSRALLKKGVALDRLLDSIIIDKRIKGENLFVGDRNAILLAARISGYGSDYSTKITCPSCETNQTCEFDLHTFGVYEGNGFIENEITDNGNGTFNVVLPRTKLDVTFKLLSGIDERKLVNHIDKARKSKKEEKTVTTQLKQVIIAVNGHPVQKNIEQIVNNLPSLDASFLRSMVKLVTPNVDMIQNFECNSCDYEQELEVPLTADFFWPDR